MTDNNTVQAYMNNQGAHASLIATRINPTEELKEIEEFLSASKISLKFNQETGTYYQEKVPYGPPIANELGVATLMSMIKSVINPMNVQGNFDADRYDDYVYHTRVDLTFSVLDNCYLWEIKDEHLEMVVDNIMRFVEPFMSRLVNDGERKSLIPQFKSEEKHVVQQPKEEGAN